MKKHLKLCLILSAIIFLYFIFLHGLSGHLHPKTSAPEPVRTLSIWYWDPSVVDLFEQFSKDHKEVQLDYTYVPNYEYANLLSTTIATGAPLPDICVLHGEYASDFLYLPLWEDLSEPPYNLSLADFDSSIHNRMMTDQGNIVAIPCDIPASGLMYRTNTMQSVFSLSSPEQVENAFPTWQALLDASIAAKDSHENDFFLFSSLDDAGTVLFNQTSQAYLENDTFVQSERMCEILSILCTLRDHNLTDTVSQCSPGWYDTFTQSNYLFAPWSSWLMQNGSFAKNQEKDWRLIVPPGGSYGYGGSVCCISSQSKNKDLAFSFLQYWLLSDEGAQQQLEQANLFLYSHLNDSDPKMHSLKPDFCGGQDIGDVLFHKLLPTLQLRPLTPHDTYVQIAFSRTVSAISRNPDMNAEDAYSFFCQELKTLFPSIKFEP